MVKLRIATPQDLPALLACLELVSASLLKEGNPMWSFGYPNVQDFQDDIAAERVFLLSEGVKVIGSVSVSHDITEAFFGQSKSKRKGYDLLDEIGNLGRPITILRRFFLSPFYQRKGYGTILFRDLEARYKGNDFIAAVSEGNEAVLPFFKQLGFLNFGIKEMENERFPHQFLLVKLYSEPGLCRNISW